MPSRRLVFSALCLTVLLRLPVSPATAGVLQEGEELRYKVKFGFLRLGTLVVRTFRDTADSDPAHYHVAIIVRSNPDIPFVNILEYNESLLSATTLRVRCFYGKYETSSEHNIVRANYDESRRCVSYLCTDSKSGQLMRCDTTWNAPPYVDGPALLTFARANAGCGKVVTVPTFVSGEMSSTTLDFTHGREFVEVGALDAPVRTRRYDGSAAWTHSADGTTGEFSGWVSDDDAAVPIKASMKMLLGSVTLELEKWTRPGWNPPVGNAK